MRLVYCVIALLLAVSPGFALEYTYNSTSGIYNITAGTADDYYNTSQVDPAIYPPYFEYNETSDPYIKMIEIDISTKNESELKEIIKLCDDTIRHGRDLLNGTHWLEDGVNFGYLIDYCDFMKINEVTNLLVRHRCEAEMALKKMNASGYRKLTDEDVKLFEEHRLYPDALAYEYYKKCVIQLREDRKQVEHQRTLGIKTEPGNFDSTKVIVPMGNYTVEFETRSLEDFNVQYENMTTEVGSGKNYHTEEFRVSEFEMKSLVDAPNQLTLQISVAQYIGPSKYEATNPFDGYKAVDYKYYEHLGAIPVQVDGHSASLYQSYYTENNKRPNRYAIVYAFNTGTTKTFVMIKTYMANYDKDVSLWIETLHVERR